VGGLAEVGLVGMELMGRDLARLLLVFGGGLSVGRDFDRVESEVLSEAPSGSVLIRLSLGGLLGAMKPLSIIASVVRAVLVLWETPLLELVELFVLL